MALRLGGILEKRVPFAETLRIERQHEQLNLIKEFRDASTFEALHTRLKSFTLPDFEADEDANTNKKRGKRRERPILSPWSIPLVYAWLIFSSKRRVFANYTAMIDAHIEQAERPFAARGPRIPTPRDMFNQMSGSAPAYTRFSHLEMCMNSGLLLCALALRAWFVQNGSYPDSLSELKGCGILASVPDDPFASVLGTPFPYRRLENGSYLLYSVGPDGVDDGGTPIDLSSKPEGWRRRFEATDVGDWVVGVNVGYAAPRPAAN